MKGFEMVSWVDILGGSSGDPLANFGEQYFFTNPRMETGDERYSWVIRCLLAKAGSCPA
jgi:hypothetical protein